MAAGDFFGGFAQAFGQGLLKAQEEREAESAKQRQLQIQLAIDQVNRPDFRPELRPVAMENIIKLAGGEQKGKKKGEFDTALKTVLGLITGPQEISTTTPQITGELPSAARMAQTPTFVQQDAQPQMTPVADYPVPGQPGFRTPPLVPQETELPITARTAPSTIVSGVPTRRTVQPFLSPDEMQQQQLKGLRGKLQLEKEFDKTPESPWRLTGEVFTDEQGNNRGIQENKMTGETREVILPKGTPKSVTTQSVRNVGMAGRAGKTTDKKLLEEAKELAILGSGNPNPDQATIESYFDEAARALQRRKALGEDVQVATAGSRRAQAAGTLANIPQRGEPNVPKGRQFGQITTQIEDVQRKRDALTKKGGGRAMLGVTLKDGTKITAETMRDPKKAIELRTRYLQELDEEINTLRAERSKIGKPTDTAPAKGGRNIPDIGQRTQMDLPEGTTKQVGETFTIGQHTFKVVQVIRPGRVRAERVK